MQITPWVLVHHLPSVLMADGQTNSYVFARFDFGHALLRLQKDRLARQPDKGS